MTFRAVFSVPPTSKPLPPLGGGKNSAICLNDVLDRRFTIPGLGTRLRLRVIYWIGNALGDTMNDVCASDVIFILAFAGSVTQKDGLDPTTGSQLRYAFRDTACVKVAQ